MSRKPNVYIIAGPNGAGKTTFAKEFLPQYTQCTNFVNADLIAAGLSPFSPVAASIKAGRLLLEQVDQFLEQKADFAFETTLAGKTYIPLLKNIHKKGYQIHLFFLWIPDVQISLARIKERVAYGGHDVPAKDVRRRFARSTKNLFKFYRPLLDCWSIWDNSKEKPVLIAEEICGKLNVIDQKAFELIKKV